MWDITFCSEEGKINGNGNDNDNEKYFLAEIKDNTLNILSENKSRPGKKS